MQNFLSFVPISRAFSVRVLLFIFEYVQSDGKFEPSRSLPTQETFSMIPAWHVEPQGYVDLCVDLIIPLFLSPNRNQKLIEKSRGFLT